MACGCASGDIRRTGAAWHGAACHRLPKCRFDWLFAHRSRPGNGRIGGVDRRAGDDFDFRRPLTVTISTLVHALPTARSAELVEAVLKQGVERSGTQTRLLASCYWLQCAEPFGNSLRHAGLMSRKHIGPGSNQSRGRIRTRPISSLCWIGC